MGVEIISRTISREVWDWAEIILVWGNSLFYGFVCFDSLRLDLSKQLWTCWDGQFTLPHFFLSKLD